MYFCGELRILGIREGINDKIKKNKALLKLL